MAAESADTKATKIQEASQTKTCGIIMPISAIDGCTADHWLEVKSIISESVKNVDTPKFEAKLVSDADDIGVIQKRIVQNIYYSDIIVCDVSGKNPNVMFELGMRLAFDKPAIIIIDDKTDYSFDTGIIEHIKYPRDLRFSRIIDFKNTLTEKISATFKRSKEESDHSTFLKNFGQFTVSKIEGKVTTSENVIIESLGELQQEMRRLRRMFEIQRRSSDSKNKDIFSSIPYTVVVNSLSEFLRKYPKSEWRKMADMPSTMEHIERACEAPSIFDSPSDFHDAYHQASHFLTSLAKN